MCRIDSIDEFTDRYVDLQTPVCAGLKGKLVHGLEKHFVVNHLGHFVFVNRLLDRLYFSWQGRIVVVASRAAYGGAPEDGIQFDDLQASRDYSVSRGLWSLQARKCPLFL